MVEHECEVSSSTSHFGGRVRHDVKTAGLSPPQILDVEKGVVRLLQRRNHPRMIPSPTLMLQGYRAILDIFPIAATASAKSPIPVNDLNVTDEEKKTLGYCVKYEAILIKTRY